MSTPRGEFKWRIEILRGRSEDDGLATVPAEPIPDIRRWAKKTDVSDAERMRAGQNGSDITCRFVVLSDSLTRSLTTQDVILCDGVEYGVIGTKDVGGRRVEVEISASSSSNAPDQL